VAPGLDQREDLGREGAAELGVTKLVDELQRDTSSEGAEGDR
jgi:hypothetical protein